MTKKVGVLAIQGSFAEHGQKLTDMGKDFVWVKDKAVLESVTHLIIPGGESTTMRKLLKEYDMWEILKRPDLCILGTCAGAILLSDFTDIEIDRNAYGAQQDSFIADLESELFKSLKGVFIRAPKIINSGSGEMLASFESEPVLVRQKNLLLATFHPELSGGEAVYRYFLDM